MEAIERIYTDKLESGNREHGMQRLRVPLLEQNQPRTVIFRLLGLLIGKSVSFLIFKLTYLKFAENS